MKDKIVEIARFDFPAEAYTLMALLRAEGIHCELQNERTTQQLTSLVTGGARLVVLESDLPRALEIIKDGGYKIPEQ